MSMRANKLKLMHAAELPPICTMLGVYATGHGKEAEFSVGSFPTKSLATPRNHSLCPLSHSPRPPARLLAHSHPPFYFHSSFPRARCLIESLRLV